METKMGWLLSLLCCAGLLLAYGCGDDAVGGGGDAGHAGGAGGDAGDSGNDPASIAGLYPRAYTGQTEESYSYVDLAGTGLITPDRASADDATVTPSSDYLSVTVEIDQCTGTGNYAPEASDLSRGQLYYELDPELVSCVLMVEGSSATLTDLVGAVRWDEFNLHFFVSGDADTIYGSSLFIIEFNGS